MRSSRCFWLFLASSWVGLLLGGWYVLLRYEFTPGAAGGVPARWPEGTRLSLDSGRPTLVLFAHRSCPCTRTTLQELDSILLSSPGGARVHIVLVAPKACEGDRVASTIEEQAGSLPGAEVTTDADGTETRRFHVRTSGHLVLYGSDGRLLFSGGITQGRGHAGDSFGRRGVLALLRNEEIAPKTAPVFGCSLFGTDSELETEAKAWDQ